MCVMVGHCGRLVGGKWWLWVVEGFFWKVVRGSGSLQDFSGL